MRGAGEDGGSIPGENGCGVIEVSRERGGLFQLASLFRSRCSKSRNSSRSIWESSSVCSALPSRDALVLPKSTGYSKTGRGWIRGMKCVDVSLR